MGSARQTEGFAARILYVVAVEGIEPEDSPLERAAAQDRSMNFLLDTNVVSELSKPAPHAAVMAWIDAQNEDALFLSVVTLAELRYGVERLSTGARKRQLSLWLDNDLVDRFRDRWIMVDGVIAEEWGRINARCDRLGRPIAALDALIASTAPVHDRRLA